MKLLRYQNFIKESKDIDIWMSETQVLNLFQSFIDDEYSVDIEKTFSRSGNEITENDRIMTNNEDIYLGWIVSIVRDVTKPTENLTNEFKSILTSLRQNGYNILIETRHKYEIKPSKIDEDQIKFNRGIYFKIDDSGTLENELDYIHIYLIQTEPQVFTNKNIAEYHNWFGYESDGDEIYFEMSIEDLAYLMLDRREHDRGGYVDLLTNGIDRDNYDSIYYIPNISDLIISHLNNSQLEKIIKCLIKEVGIDDIISEINDISGESLKEESEIIQFLIKERFKKTLEELLKDNELEIVREIRQIIGDYNVDAHVSKNEEEMYKEFDRILEREGIKFKKEYKLGKRFYYIKSPMVDGLVKTYYEDYLWIYKLYYQDNWNAKFEYEYESFKDTKLESMFNEWANSEYFNYKLDPYYSDYGDVDQKSLNSEIDSLLDGCLNEN